MPALSRSFHSVSLKVLSRSAFRGSGFEALKSGTAMRTFSTPRPVPVLIQSCAWATVAIASSVTTAAENLKPQSTQRRRQGRREKPRHFFASSAFPLRPLRLKAFSFASTQSPLVIEPEFHAYLAPRVIRRQRRKRINPLQRPYRRLIQRGHAARLLDLHVRRMPASFDVKRHIDPVSILNSRIDFVLQPVL